MTQPEALRLAEMLSKHSIPNGANLQAAKELRRLHEFEVAFKEFIDKTEWVQKTNEPHEHGMHRADILTQRIRRLHEENTALRQALAQDHGFDRTASHMAGEYVDTNWDTSDMAHRTGGLSMEQEPVAYRKEAHGMWFYIENKPSPPNDDYKPLYTAPLSKPWASLTDEELTEIYAEFWLALMPVRKAIASAIEAKLKEKNT